MKLRTEIVRKLQRSALRARRDTRLRGLTGWHRFCFISLGGAPRSEHDDSGFSVQDGATFVAMIDPLIHRRDVRTCEVFNTSHVFCGLCLSARYLVRRLRLIRHGRRLARTRNLPGSGPVIPIGLHQVHGGLGFARAAYERCDECEYLHRLHGSTRRNQS
jgi:hypothetical protein